MRFTSRNEANQYYSDTLFDAQLSNCVPAVMNELGRRDLFFLLTRLLHRKDVNRDWLFHRCQEVQNEPDGMLDLWAREHYKSTIITFGKSIQDILDSHSKEPFHWKDSEGDPREVTIGIFSHTRPIAKGFLAQIMREFETNELLKDLYPDVLWRNPRKEAVKWSLDQGIIVKRKSNPKEATVEAWGLVDGQPTSKHFTVLDYDDVVTRESVTTPEQIEKTTEAWGLSLNLGSEGGVVRTIGTRYHYNDTYKTIIKRGAAKPRVYPATDNGKPEGKPVFLNSKTLRDKRLKMGSFVFACQMLQDPKADEVQGFNLDDFNYWTPEPKGWNQMNIYLLVDPASKKKKENDYTVMEVWGLGADQNYYLIDGIRDRMNLTERTLNLFKLHRLYSPIATGYEEYGIQADIEHIESEMDREHYRFNITPLGGRVSKVDRIRGLIPKAEQKRLYFPVRCLFVDYERKSKDFTQLLVSEFEDFPLSSHDDIMDCGARILDMRLNAQFPAPSKSKVPIGVMAPGVNKVETEYNLFG